MGVSSVALCVLMLMAAPQLLDRVVAVVEGDPITQSEMMMEIRVTLAMREGEEVAMRDVEPAFAERFLRDYLVTQMLIADQTRRYGTEEPSDLAVDQVSGRLRAKFSSQAAYEDFLRRFGMGEARVRDILRRDLRNDMFISRQLGPDAKGRDKREKRLENWVSQLRASSSILLLDKNGKLNPIARK